MTIQNFAHKGPRRLYEREGARGLPGEAADKLRKMLAFLDSMESSNELRLIGAWNAHVVTADRKGTWALHVTRNWRMTFRIDPARRNP